LEKRALMELLLKEINDKLIEQGPYIKSGGVSIVDASVIEASVIEARQCRPNKATDFTSGSVHDSSCFTD